MKLCILGWYGTETLGDRAILDGIIKIFAAYCPNLEINLGSLYPFFTQRTLFEDKGIYADETVTITVFDEMDLHELRDNVLKSDIVIMGGGPLMDLDEMYLIHEGFRIAKRCHKNTALFGCGFGPLIKKEYLSLTKRILMLSDVAVFRDEASREQAKRLCGEYGPTVVLDDPAIVSIINYRENHERREDNYLAVNFREYPRESYGDIVSFDKGQISALISELSKRYESIRLVPMHTFFIGGDDRDFLHKLILFSGLPNVSVVCEPQNLYQLYETYANASACVAMRYHAVVMQTILNGNNYVVDYTDPINGKIASFLRMTDKEGFYNNRVFNLHDKEAVLNADCLYVLKENERFHYDGKENAMREYHGVVKSFLV